jgi:hypothetical protein
MPLVKRAAVQRAHTRSLKENDHDSQTKIGTIQALLAQVDPRTGKRRNLGTFGTREAAMKHEREVQFFKSR